MRKLRVENLIGKILLVFLILWGAASFFIFQTLPAFEWAFLAVSLIATYFTLRQRAEYFILTTIIFSGSYLFYGIESTYGLPLWLVLIGLIVVFGAAFWFLGQRLVASRENFLLVLTFFLISILELYLTLSFWLINPLTKSLIMSVFSYIFVGYISNISENENVDRKFFAYVYTAIIVLSILVFTVSWGR